MDFLLEGVHVGREQGSEAEMEEMMENGDIEWMEWKMGGKRR